MISFNYYFFTLFHCFNSSFKTCKLSTKVKPLVQKITFLVNVSIKEQTKQNKRRKAYAIKSSGLHFQPTLVVHRTSTSYKSLDSTARGIERFSRFLRTSQLYLSRYKTRENVVSRLIINLSQLPDSQTLGT